MVQDALSEVELKGAKNVINFVRASCAWKHTFISLLNWEFNLNPIFNNSAPTSINYLQFTDERKMIFRAVIAVYSEHYFCRRSTMSFNVTF
jgi:hypothetical protein